MFFVQVLPLAVPGPQSIPHKRLAALAEGGETTAELGFRGGTRCGQQ